MILFFHPTRERFLKDELVPEEEWERGRERLRLDVEPEETDGEIDGPFPREPDPGAGHGVNVHFQLNADRFRHLVV